MHFVSVTRHSVFLSKFHTVHFTLNVIPEIHHSLEHVPCIFMCVSVATVHCERLGRGEDGGDPEGEAGPGGEGFWLHEL